MKKIMVTLDEETAAWAHAQAAQRNISLSRFVAEVLRERIRAREYEDAYRAWREEKPFDLKGPWKPYPKREELYDRRALGRR